MRDQNKSTSFTFLAFTIVTETDLMKGIFTQILYYQSCLSSIRTYSFFIDGHIHGKNGLLTSVETSDECIVSIRSLFLVVTRPTLLVDSHHASS